MNENEKPDIIGEWTGSIYQKWASNYIRNNMWRVTYTKGDYDDMLQEAAIEFILMKRDYADKVNSPQHFMRLYQLCLHSHITNISHKDSHSRQYLAKIPAKEPSIRPQAEINVILNESSSELKEVLKIFFTAPAEVLETLRADVVGHGAKLFWKRVLRHVGIAPEKAEVLQKELEDLLS